ncbi:MAG: hypothetical protein LH606_08370 [Cytophagaceae bacterium]|nr:hypothetical protein [Cytophagaceae bacterium]
MKRFVLVYTVIAVTHFSCERKKTWQFKVNDVTSSQVFRINKGNLTEGVPLVEHFISELDGKAIIQQWLCNEEQVNEILKMSSFPKGTTYQPRIIEFDSGKTETKDLSEVYAEVILMRFVPGSAKKGKLILNFRLGQR